MSFRRTSVRLIGIDAEKGAVLCPVTYRGPCRGPCRDHGTTRGRTLLETQSRYHLIYWSPFTSHAPVRHIFIDDTFHCTKRIFHAQSLYVKYRHICANFLLMSRDSTKDEAGPSYDDRRSGGLPSHHSKFLTLKSAMTF